MSLRLLPRPCVLLFLAKMLLSLFGTLQGFGVSLCGVCHVSQFSSDHELMLQESKPSGLIRELNSICMLLTRRLMWRSHILNTSFPFIATRHNYTHKYTEQSSHNILNGRDNSTQEYLSPIWVFFCFNLLFIRVKIYQFHIFNILLFEFCLYISFLRW